MRLLKGRRSVAPLGATDEPRARARQSWLGDHMKALWLPVLSRRAW